MLPLILASLVGMQTFTEADAAGGRTLVVCDHEEFAVRLPVRLGTGYRWRLLRDPSHVCFLETSTPPEFVEEGEGGGSGHGSFMVFRYYCVRPVESLKLRFAYERGADRAISREVTFSIRVLSADH